MARFSYQLPPFSPDYSGVASVFFDLNSVTAMHDAAGCTGNYTGYDDPRWYGSRAGIFCSGLRELDAVMGDDEKLISRMLQAADDLNPDLLCLIGSPVPMVIGCDMEGIGVELEERAGLPTLGFQTTGTKYYDYGVALACNKLVERFCQPCPIVPGRVNLVGGNPMDFAKGEDLTALKTLLESANYTVPLTFSQGYTFEQMKGVASAQVNIAVSRGGYLIAKQLEETFGTPYLCGLPVGSGSGQEFLARLEQVIQTGESGLYQRLLETPPTALIIGEQVQGNAIRTWLAGQGVSARVATLFGLEEALASQGDLNLPEEQHIRKVARGQDYQVVVADPTICELLEGGGDIQCIPLPLYGVSSKFHHQSGATLIEEHFVAEEPLKAYYK